MAKISVQLWSLHDETAKDFFGTLEKVAAFGYDGVEFAGFGDISAEDMKQKLDSLGLLASGAHIGMDAIENDADNIIAYNKTIGNKYIICPALGADTKELCEENNKRFMAINKKYRDNGLILGYHNHAHEFVAFDGEYANDIILGNDNELVYEVDVFWTEYAGIDTLAYLKKLGKRCPLIHLKDMKINADGSKGDIAFGEGILDHKAIIDTAEEYCSPEWFVVEWEAFGEQDAFEAVDISLKNVKRLYK